MASEQGYLPITLSGIVKEDDEKVTMTKMPIAIIYRLPFFSIDEEPCSLSIAMGPDVAVNFLIGLTFSSKPVPPLTLRLT